MTDGRYSARGALVTGATGFIGSSLARRLIADGVRKVVIPERADPPAVESARCDLIQVDLCDVPSIRHVINEKGCDLVFHLSARTNPADVRENPYDGFEANVTNTYNVLEACRLARADGLDVRAVIASSDLVYGNATPSPVPEAARLAPGDPYAASKACADRLAYCYAKTYEMPVGIARLASVYGPGDPNLWRLVPDAARRLLAGDSPATPAGGADARDWIHIDDAVDAILAIERSLDDAANWGRAWNAAGDSPITDVELLAIMAAAAGRGETSDTAQDGSEPTYLDSSAIRSELGWRPKHALGPAIAETYRWYADALA